MKWYLDLLKKKRLLILKNYNIKDFKNKKILFGVKEAGAGSLLAELIKNIEPNKQSMVLSSSIASIYFKEIDIEVKTVDKEISNKKIGNLIELLSPDYVWLEHLLIIR